MLMQTLRVNFAPNKWSEAEEWGKKMTAYIRKVGWQGSLLRRRTGDRTSFVWYSQHSSMAEAEDQYQKFISDSELMKIWREGATEDWYLGATRNYWDEISE